jgi:hypothetical protein
MLIMVSFSYLVSYSNVLVDETVIMKGPSAYLSKLRKSNHNLNIQVPRNSSDISKDHGNNLLLGLVRSKCIASCLGRFPSVKSEPEYDMLKH